MNHRGFSVIELLAVIAIVSVLAGITVANFTQLRMKFALSRSASLFAQTVRKAQNMASSAVRYTDQSGNLQTVAGYGIYVDLNTLSNKQYILYADSNDNQQYDLPDYIVETVDMAAEDPGIIIRDMSNGVNNVSINFGTSLVVTITPLGLGQNSLTVNFALENDQTVAKSILVNKAGLVQEQ